jgi:hypothetical protein
MYFDARTGSGNFIPAISGRKSVQGTLMIVHLSPTFTLRHEADCYVESAVPKPNYPT